MAPTVVRLTPDSYLVRHGDGQSTQFNRGPYCHDPNQAAEQWKDWMEYSAKTIEAGLIPNPQYV